MIGRKFFLHLADAVIVSVLLTALAASGFTDDWDNRVSDKFYQSLGEKSPDILIVGIDNVTLNKFGARASIQRRDVAKVLNNLNRDPNNRPAVIGIDILFTGENSADPEGDKILAEAAAQCGNVVVASEADVHDDLAEDIENPWSETWEWIPPYPALISGADTGHINAPNENDGIIRHDLLYVNVTERGQLYSFGRVIYEKFCAVKGIKPTALPETDDGIYYLVFHAKNYAAENNFYDVLEGNFNPESFKDKIVLIGPYASGLQDAAPTALDRSDLMFGIDIHANAIQSFMKGDCPRDASKVPQLIVLFVVAFLSEFFFRNAKLEHITICWLTVCIGWLVICHILRNHGLILHVSWIPFAENVLFVGAVATNYMLARNEKERVTSTFGRYVDPVVMRQLLDGGSKSLDLGGELKNIAVLFVDIRGFTSMSEELPPPTVVEILNRYLTLTTECIRKHHGTLDKFVGDCTMAFWNAPIRQEKPVLLACKAALDMLKGSEALGKELMERYGRKIAFGIGVHWGSAVVGNIGTPSRMDYTAIGDTVNTAARLEANARGGTILISRTVANILGDCANVTSLGNSIKLKGKSEDFEILILNSLTEVD